MQISPVNSVYFGKNLFYKNRYIKNTQDPTREIIRAHLEEQFGPNFYYVDQIEKERTLEYIPKGGYRTETEGQINSNSKKVDFDLLEKSKIYALNERRKNELYTGVQLSDKPEQLEALKQAGINSVLCLVVYDNYEENAEKAGLNFTCLNKLGDARLNVFDIRDNLLKDLIDHPERYADKSKKGKIAGLKEFINILNGENEKYPLPVYFGCQLGTDRTYLWYKLYTILKDAKQDEPLSPETVKELVKFSKTVEDVFRW